MLFSLHGVFVTGTDTGVGKTWVAAHLIRELRAHGEEIVRPLKPVESGCVQNDSAPPNTLWAQDAETLRQAAQMDESEPVVLHKFQAPIAPALAAQQEGVVVRLRDLTSFCCRDGTLVVEGAGGWRTPLAEDGDVQALALKLGLPVLVVAEDRLGAINHTLLTCEAVQRSHCQLAGVVLNRLQPVKGDFGNLSVLERHLRGVPVWQTRHGQWLGSTEARHLIATFMGMGVAR